MAGHDVVRNRLAGRVGRLRDGPGDPVAKAVEHRFRDPFRQGELLEHSQGIAEGRRIPGSRPGTDGGQLVADHVGDHERRGSSRRQQGDEAAALDRGEVFADGVDFVDVGAAGEQQRTDPRLVLQGDARRRSHQQRRRPPGQQHQDPAAPAGRPEVREEPPGRLDGVDIRDGMPRLLNHHAGNFEPVTVLHDDPPAHVLPGEPAPDPAGERGGRLAGAEQEDRFPARPRGRQQGTAPEGPSGSRVSPEVPLQEPAPGRPRGAPPGESWRGPGEAAWSRAKRPFSLGSAGRERRRNRQPDR